MLNKTEVALLALGKLGSSLHIIDLDNNTTQPQHVKVINRQINSSFETFLEYHPWQILTAYASLSLVTENPIDNWAFEYSHPKDVQVIRRIQSGSRFPKTTEFEDEKFEWQEVFTPSLNHIYTDVGDACIEYTKNPGIDTLLPNHLGRAWASFLAEDIAPSIILNNFSKVKNTLASDLLKLRTEAVATDMGRSPMKKEPASLFERVRLR